MALKDTLQTLAQTALRAAALSVPITYVEVTERSSYNATTDVSTAEEIHHPNVPATFVEYTRQEINANDDIESFDRRVLIAVLDMPVSAPKKGHRLIMQDFSAWRVIDARTDPANATWDLQVRPGAG